MASVLDGLPNVADLQTAMARAQREAEAAAAKVGRNTKADVNTLTAVSARQRKDSILAAEAAAASATRTNADNYARNEALARETSIAAAGDMQKYSDNWWQGTIDTLLGGPGNMRELLDTAAGVVDDVEASTAFYRDNIMPQVLTGLQETLSGTLANTKAMIAGELSEGTLRALRRSEAEVGAQMGRLGQAALYSRTGKTLATIEETQALGLKMAGEALGLASTTMAGVNQTLAAPGQAAADYTSLMKEYINPQRFDPSSLYGQAMEILSKGSMIDPNNAYNVAAQAGGNLLGETSATMRSGRELEANTFLNMTELGYAGAGNVMSHAFDMAGIRVAEQTANLGGLGAGGVASDGRTYGGRESLRAGDSKKDTYGLVWTLSPGGGWTRTGGSGSLPLGYTGPANLRANGSYGYNSGYYGLGV